MERFPEKLRQSRKRVRLSQSQLAERVGVTQRSMTNYECGRAQPRKKVLRKMAEELHVTVEYLTNDSVDDPQAGRLREERLSTARALFGRRGEQEMNELMERNAAFFAGGSVDQETKDAFFDALMTAYITCKNEARARYGSSADDENASPAEEADEDGEENGEEEARVEAEEPEENGQ